MGLLRPFVTHIDDIRARGCKISMMPFTLVICTGNGGEGKGHEQVAEWRRTVRDWGTTGTRFRHEGLRYSIHSVHSKTKENMQLVYNALTHLWYTPVVQKWYTHCSLVFKFRCYAEYKSSNVKTFKYAKGDYEKLRALVRECDLSVIEDMPMELQEGLRYLEENITRAMNKSIPKSNRNESPHNRSNNVDE